MQSFEKEEMKTQKNKKGKTVGQLTLDNKKFLISLKGIKTWITANKDMTLNVINE